MRLHESSSGLHRTEVRSNTGKIWLIKTHGHYIPIAHELAHVRLLGERWIMLKVFDNELLTDLTVVHFGMGIFLAKTTRNWPSGNSKWTDTKFRKKERPVCEASPW